jgi:bile acid transporter
VERFSEAGGSVDHVDKFFKTLLAQDISIDRLNDRVHVSRYLPVKDAIFDRTREILFGYQDENGKGGILADLAVNGIECDLQSVYLYRAPKLLNPIDQALDLDLDQINAIAHQSGKRFYSSLLGRFLTPEQESPKAERGDFAPILWMPGALPQSTRILVERLDHHDIVLLEGPPGTGKTFTIMNLLLHCINRKQRVLIVSDQQAAIEALVEKLEDYLIGGDRGTPAERKWKDLLFSAIKVVDTVETSGQSLADLVAELTETFKVQQPEPGTGRKGENLVREIKRLGAKIEQLKARIGRKITDHMGEHVPFDHRVLNKSAGRSDIESLTEFTKMLLGENARWRPVIDAFIENRCRLLEGGMGECFDFFKIPARNFDSELKLLEDDEKLLAGLLEQTPRTLEEFQVATSGYARHEIIRFLEGALQARLSRRGNALSRLLRKIRSGFRCPFHSSVGELRRMVRDQLELLARHRERRRGVRGNRPRRRGEGVTMQLMPMLAAMQAPPPDHEVVTQFEQVMLVGLVFIIMFGLGAGLTPRDFISAVRRPHGLIIGWVTQFGIMPFLAFLLVLSLILQLPSEFAAPLALGALLMGSVPAGTTSNIFTFFSKGNLALSVMMTTNSTLWALLMTPLALHLYGTRFMPAGSELQIPIANIVVTLAIMLVPVAFAMVIRRYSPNIGAVMELMGGFFGLFFIVFLIVTWVPRNWQLLTGTPWQVYLVAICLGLFGITVAYLIARAIRLHPMNARTVGLETGIQNGPLAIAIVLLSFAGSPQLGLLLLVPALYSLFIVIVATFVTFYFRRANLAEEQKIPSLL